MLTNFATLPILITPLFALPSEPPGQPYPSRLLDAYFSRLESVSWQHRHTLFGPAFRHVPYAVAMLTASMEDGQWEGLGQLLDLEAVRKMKLDLKRARQLAFCLARFHTSMTPG